MTADTPLYLHDGVSRFRLVQWLPQTPRYWSVPAIVALDDGRILYREAPFFLCTRGQEGGCRWCERH